MRAVSLGLMSKGSLKKNVKVLSACRGAGMQREKKRQQRTHVHFDPAPSAPVSRDLAIKMAGDPLCARI